MAYQYKEDTATPVINFASRMDDRQNNETIAVDPNTTGFTMVSLTNGDLFNTKSLRSRLGVVNVCPGIVGGNNKQTCMWDFSGADSEYASGTSTIDIITDGYYQGSLSNINNYIGMLYVPSGAQSISSITLNGLGSYSTTLPSGNMLLPVDISVLIYKTDQTIQTYPSAIIGPTYPSWKNVIHDISLGGVINTPPEPQLNLNFGTVESLQNSMLPPPNASSEVIRFDFGKNYIHSGAYFSAVQQSGTFNFTSPVALHAGCVYAIIPQFVPVGASGTLVPQYTFDTKRNYVNDISKNTQTIITHLNSNPPESQTYALAITSTGKTVFSSCIKDYTPATWEISIVDTCDTAHGAPIQGGNIISIPNTPYITVDPTYNPSKNAPSTYVSNGKTVQKDTSTTTVSFGQVLSIPSGTQNIIGSYIYANTVDSQITYGYNVPSGNLTVPYPSYWTRKQKNYDPNAYNIRYEAKLWKINSSVGSFIGNYSTSDLTELGTYTGDFVFDNPINKYYNLPYPTMLYDNTSDEEIYGGSNYNLKKIYAIFDNPIPVISSGATNDYLLTYTFLDNKTNSKITDFIFTEVINPQTSLPAPALASPIAIGLRHNDSLQGQYVVDTNNNGTYSNYTVGLGPFQCKWDLTCGLLFSPFGAYINGIYDYRVGENRTQKVMVASNGKLMQAPLYSCDFKTIYSSGTSEKNDIWSFATYQNLLFGHQYSKISGVCWDQIYSNPSGDSVQLHGQRPTFHVQEISGNGIGMTGYSGSVVQFMLGTQYGSGGIRSSEIISHTISGNTNVCFQLLGGPSGTIPVSGANSYNSICNPSGFPTHESQYAFDILPQSTYAFATEPDGQIFYLAGLQDSPKTGANNLYNPLPNVNSFYGGIGPSGVVAVSGTFINDLTTTTLTQQIPNVVNYDQNYLTQQINTPKFKKLLVFKDYLLGIGDPDNPSRLWYSEQYAPQIFGLDGQFTGYVDIDPNNGSPLTGFAVFKDYLLVFKYNSTYRLSYTQDPSIPFNITQLSNTIGSLGFFNQISTDYGVFILSQWGPALATYAGVDTVGDEIMPFFKTLDHTDLTFSVGIHDRERQQIYFSISNHDLSPDLNTGLVYSYAEKAWGLRQGALWSVAAPIGDEDNFTMLYIGNNIGELKRISVGDLDQDVMFDDGNGNSISKNITLSAESPWLNLGNSQHLKQLKNIRINCDESIQDLRIDVYFDQNSNKPVYSRILDMGGPVNDRVVSLAQMCRTVKFVFTSIGDAGPVKLNSMQITYKDLGPRQNI